MRECVAETLRVAAARMHANGQDVLAVIAGA